MAENQGIHIEVNQESINNIKEQFKQVINEGRQYLNENPIDIKFKVNDIDNVAKSLRNLGSVLEALGKNDVKRNIKETADEINKVQQVASQADNRKIDNTEEKNRLNALREEKEIYNSLIPLIREQYSLETEIISNSKLSERTLNFKQEELQNLKEKINAKKQLITDEKLLNNLKEHEEEEGRKSLSKIYTNNDIERVASLGNIDRNSSLKIGSTKDEISKYIKSLNSGDTIITKYNEPLNKQGKIMQEIEYKVREANNQWHKYKMSIDEATQSTYHLDKGTDDALNRQKSIGGMLKNTFGKITKYINIDDVVYESINQLKKGIQLINDLNKSQTNIRMIKGYGKEEVDELTKSYSNLAGQLHETTKSMMGGAEEFLRAGYNKQETAELLKASTVGSKLSGQNQKDTSEQLISITSGFKMNASEAMSVVDKLTTINNNSGTSFSELARAMQKCSSSAQMVGVDINQLSSWVGTISSATGKSADSIGDSLKSLFARYQDIKQGKNFDVNNEPLSDIEESLGKVGVALRKDKNTFRDMGDVLKDLNGKWKDLSQTQQADIAKSFAGTEQKENFLVLMNNFNNTLNMQEKLLGANGSAMERYKAYGESTEAKINDLKHAVEQFWMNCLQSGTINRFLEFATKTVQTLDIIINKCNGLNANLAILGGTLIFVIKNAVSLSTALGGISKVFKAGTGFAGLMELIGISAPVLAVIAALTVAVGALGYGIYRQVQFEKEAMAHRQQVNEKIEETTDKYKKLTIAMETANKAEIQSGIAELEAKESRYKILSKRKEELEKNIKETEQLEKDLNNPNIKGAEREKLNSVNWKEKRIELNGYNNELQKITPELKDLIEVENKSGNTISATTGKMLMLEVARKRLLDFETDANLKALMEDKTLYDKKVKYNKDIVKELGDAYKIDLGNFQSLAEAKWKVESELIKELSKKWGDYYDVQSNGFNYETLKDQDFIIDATGDSYLPNGYTHLMNRVDEDGKRVKEVADKFKKIALEMPDLPDSSSSTFSPHNNSGNSSDSKTHHVYSPTDAKLDEYKVRIDDVNTSLQKYDRMLNIISNDVKKYKENDNLQMAFKKENELIDAQTGKLKLLNDSREKLINVKNDVANKFKEEWGFEVNENTSQTDFDRKYNELYGSEVDFGTGDDAEQQMNAHKNKGSLFKQLSSDFLNSLSEVQKNGEEYSKVEQEILSSKKEKWNILFEMNDRKLKSNLNDIDDIQDEIDMLDAKDKSNYDEKKKLINEIIDSEILYISKVEHQRDQLVEQLKTLEKGSAEWNLINDKIRECGKNIEETTKKMIQQKDESKRIQEEQQKNIDDITKRVMEVNRKKHEDEKDMLEENHRKAMENIEEEKNATKEFFDEKKRELDAEKDAVDQKNKIDKLYTEKNKLQEQYDELLMDSSLEAESKKKELSIKIEEKQKLIDDELYKSSIETKKKELDKKKDIAEKEFEYTKDVETKKYNVKKKEIEDSLKNYQLHAEAIKMISSSTAEQIFQMLSEYEDEFGEGLTRIGAKIKEELCKNIIKAKEDLNDLGLTDEETNSSDYENHKRRVFASSDGDSNTNDYLTALQYKKLGYEVIDLSKLSPQERANIDFDKKYDLVVGGERATYNLTDEIVGGSRIWGNDRYETRDAVKKDIETREKMSQSKIPLQKNKLLKSPYKYAFDDTEKAKLYKYIVNVENPISAAMLNIKVPDNQVNKNTKNTLSIQNLINVNGNVDKKVMPSLESIAGMVTNQIVDVMNMNGINNG